MQKFQYEYEEQVAIWKKEKGDMQMRLHEVSSHAERLKYECQESIENYKSKYIEYKQKLKKANQSIQTLTTRVAKYELAMVAEREVGKVDSIRGALRAAGLAPRHQHGIRSSEGALSPGMIGQQLSDFNLHDYNNEFENQELNEEIKKLLLEN